MYAIRSYYAVIVEMQGIEKEILQEKKDRLKLTERETQILQLLCQGLSNNEIAEKQYVSLRTVETTKSRVITSYSIHYTKLYELGITGSIVPMKVDPGFLKDDMPWMLAVSFLLLLFILPFKGGILTRWKGAVLGVLYGVYVYILYFRTV